MFWSYCPFQRTETIKKCKLKPEYYFEFNIVGPKCLVSKAALKEQGFFITHTDMIRAAVNRIWERMGKRGSKPASRTGEKLQYLSNITLHLFSLLEDTQHYKQMLVLILYFLLSALSTMELLVYFGSNLQFYLAIFMYIQVCSHAPSVDLVVTWVNGSDPTFLINLHRHYERFTNRNTSVKVTYLL